MADFASLQGVLGLAWSLKVASLEDPQLPYELLTKKKAV
jgi:hypothetical protein